MFPGRKAYYTSAIVAKQRGPAYHLYLPQCIITIVVEVVRLPVVDAHYTKQQLTVQSQCQRAAGSPFRPNDNLDIFIDPVLQHLSFCKLFVLIGGKPDARKLA